MSIIANDSFIGALNKYWPEKIGPTECSVLKNFVTIDGSATSIEGRNLYNQVEILASTPVKSMTRFYKTGHTVNETSTTTKQGWTLARCGEYVWLACEQVESVDASILNATSITFKTTANIETVASTGTVMVTPASGDTTPYALAYTAKNETTGVITVGNHPAIPNASKLTFCDFRPILKTTGNTNAVDFEPFNGRMYMAINGLYRFDGFYYAVSTCDTTSGSATVTFATGVDLTNVKRGDKFMAKKADGTWVSWFSIISKNVGNRTITLHTTYANTLNDVDYIIVRVNNAGIAAAPTTPAVAASSTGGLVDAGVYRYKWVFYSATGESASVSPVASHTFAALDTVWLLLWGGYHAPEIPYADRQGIVGMRIYRTSDDDADADANYKKLVDIPFTWDVNGHSGVDDIYTDLIADTALGAAFTARTTDSAITYVPTGTIGIDHAAATASAMGAGSWKYKWTLYNSTTGTESNPSSESASVTTTAAQEVTVTMTVTDADRQADYLRVYRTLNGSELYYRAGEVAWAEGVTTTVAFVDNTKTDADLIADGYLLSNDHHNAPSGVNYVHAFNGTLMAWGRDDNPEYMHFSTVNDGEHWPTYEFGTGNDPEDVTLGGFVRMGQPGEKILSAVVDGGAYAETGGIGASLLVFTKSNRYRWWGDNWVNYRRDVVGSGGIAGRNCAVNVGGMVYWIDREKGLVNAAGQPIYEKMFPSTRYKFSDQVTRSVHNTGDYYELCSLAHWGDWLIMTWPQTPLTTGADKMAMYHLPSGTWTEIGTATYQCTAACLSVWNGGGDNGELYYGDAVTGQVWRLFAKTGTKSYWTPSSTTGVQAELRTGAILNTSRPGQIYDQQCVKRLRSVVNRPTVATQTVTTALYPNTDDTAVWSEANSVVTTEGTGADIGDRTVIDDSPYIDTRSIILGWSGTFTEQVTLQGYELHSTYRGAARR